MTVLVRDPAKLPAPVAARIRVIVGDTSDTDALRSLLASADVVISALGSTGDQQHLHTRTAGTLVQIMTTNGPKRFVGISCSHVNRLGDQKRLRHKMTSALARAFGGDAAADRSGEVPIWSFRKLNWTLVRPQSLSDAESVKSNETVSGPLQRSPPVIERQVSVPGNRPWALP